MNCLCFSWDTKLCCTGYTKRSEKTDRSFLVDKGSKKQHDIVTHNRLNWGTGFPVDVYSESYNNWFPGQIIKVMGKKQKKNVKVVYNGRAKVISVYSDSLRPLLVDSKRRSQLPFETILEKAMNLLAEHKPKKGETQIWDTFISHCQKDAQDAVGLLFQLLRMRDVKAWTDMQQDDIDISGMLEGVSQSRCFLIYLTKNYFHQVFTVFELEAALFLEKEIFIVWESDERHAGYSSFNSYLRKCPGRYRSLFGHKEAVVFERRKHLQHAQINIIVDRIMRSPKRSQRSSIMNATLRGAKSKFQNRLTVTDSPF